MAREFIRAMHRDGQRKVAWLGKRIQTRQCNYACMQLQLHAVLPVLTMLTLLV